MSIAFAAAICGCSSQGAHGTPGPDGGMDGTGGMDARRADVAQDHKEDDAPQDAAPSSACGSTACGPKVTDGGAVIDCGTCALPKSCGADEKPNVCAGGGTGKVYYVSVTGSDTNPGTRTLPFRHVSRGAAVAVAGDTVVVMDGTYDNEGVVAPNYVVNLTASGMPTDRITFMAEHRGKAVLDSMNTSTTTTCNGASAYFNLGNVSYVTLQGFVIQRGCDSGIQSNDSAHDITLRWNTFQYIANHTVTDAYGRDGIFLNGMEQNFLFDGNVFHDIGRTDGVADLHLDHGIYSCAANMTIINNVFYNLDRGYAIQTCGSATAWLIANNTFAFPNADGVALMLWNGDVTPPGTVSHFQIVNNIFYEPGATAISNMATLSGVNITDNLVYGPKTTIIDNPTGCTVAQNKMGVDPLFASTAAPPAGFALTAGSPAVDVGTGIPLVAEDFLGVARPQGSAYDLGAFER